MKKKTLGKTQYKKKKVRDTAEWRQHRLDIASEHNNLDAITNKKLLKGWNCHHLDMNEENYDDFSDHNHFVPLNKSTHELVHTLFRYYKKDKEVLDRLKEILDKMDELN